MALMKEFGMKKGNVEALLTGFEPHNLLVCEDNNILYALEAIEEKPEPVGFNRDRSYFVNRYI